MSVSFAVLKAKDCTGTIGNGRPVIGRPVVETPYRQSTMKARTICAVLVCFLVCAASMKRVCPETQPPDQMQAQCEAPEEVLVATSKAPPGNAPTHSNWVAGTAALYATLDEAVATGHNEAATQHVTDPLTDQGQFTTQEVFNGMADFAQNGPTHQARAEAEAAAAALPTPSRSGSGSPFRPSRARWLATDATGQIQPTAAADAAHHDALPAAAAAAEAAGHPAWVIEWMAADAALQQTPTESMAASAAQWRAADAALHDEAPTAADANLGTWVTTPDDPGPDRIRVPICPSVFQQAQAARPAAAQAAQPQAAQAAQDPTTRFYPRHWPNGPMGQCPNEEPLQHPMAQWLAEVCAPKGKFPMSMLPGTATDDWVARWLMRFENRIEAETTQAFRLQAAYPYPSQAAANAAAAAQAGLPGWVHHWLAEYEDRLVAWETPSWLLNWLQVSIWEYAEKRAARIRERLRAIAQATSSSSSSSGPA